MQVETSGCSYSEGLELLCKSFLKPRKDPFTVPSWALTRNGEELHNVIEPKKFKVEFEESKDLYPLLGM